MILINSIDTASFTLNGTRYVKNFVCLPAGQTHITIVGAYDTKLQILGSTGYDQVRVDGNTYGSQALLINALANVIFSKSSSSATINQNNVGVFNTTIQYAFTTPSNTILVSEIVNKINLTYGYAVSEVMTPYFFQFVRPALQQGSDTTIQKKYIYLFTGGKGSYGLGNTAVQSTQFKLIVESVLNPDDVINDDSAIINYLGEIPDGDYISVANESNWDFFDTDYNYYFSYVTDGVLFYVIFIGEAGLYGVDNVLFTEDDFVDSTNSDALPYIPTLQEVLTAGSSATTANDISINTTGGAELLYNGSEVLTIENSQDIFDAKADLVDGKVPASQLPAYVDDVLEFANLAAFPVTGESGKIYIAQDTNLTYRWSGSAYTEISASLALGETSSTAYRGDRGKTAYDHTFLSNNPHSVTKSQVGLGNVDNTSDANKPISTATQTALNGKANTGGDNATGRWPISVTGSAKQLVTDGVSGGTTFSWSNGGAAPTWLWGGNANTNSYVYSPSVLPISTATQTALNAKANDANVIHTTGNETKTGNLTIDGTGVLAYRVNRGSAIAAYLGSGSGDVGLNGIMRLFHTDNDEKVRIYASGDSWLNGGNVGIGTSTPLTKLDVWDNSNNDLIAGRVGSLGVQAFTLGGHNSDANNAGLYIKTLNSGVMTEAMRLTNDGNVGIGTSTPDIFSRVYNKVLGITGGANVAIEIGGSSQSDFDMGVGTSRFFNINTTSTESTISTIGSKPLYISTNGVIRQTISSNGNVTIGSTITPHKFNVSNNGNEGLEVAIATNVDQRVILQNYDRTASAYKPLHLNASQFIFGDLSGGNVGIGTITPSYKLDVTGNANISAGLNLGDSQNLTWGGNYSSGKPTIAANSTGILVYPSGNTYTNRPTMSVSSLDKVGIGVASLNTSSAKFTVSGATDLFGVLNVSSTASFGGEVLVGNPTGSDVYAAVNIQYLDNKLNSSPRIINDTATSAYNNTSLNGAYPSVPLGTQIVCGGIGTGVIYVKINSAGGGTWRQMYLNSL